VASRIVLVRHGPSAGVMDGRSRDRAEVASWLDARDAVGIEPQSQPPSRLTRLAGEATHLIASNLPRAIESAQRLANGRQIHVSPLLREIPLAIPNVSGRFPLWMWGTLIHLRWSYRIARGTDASAADVARAAAAVEWLAPFSSSDTLVVVVTHGVFRRLMAKQLTLVGWKSDGRHGGYSPWSSWHFIFAR
jgi:broad specificity phosphatase PhoE